MKAPASAPVKKRGTVALREAALRKLSVEQLKAVCRGCKLKIGGTKPELIERLLTKPRTWGAEKGAELLSSFKAVTAPPADVPGVPRSMLEVTDAAVLAKRLRVRVGGLARLVDKDWHDGADEQCEHLDRYVRAFEPPLRAVLKLCTSAKVAPTQAALDRCNDVLVALADSWLHIQAVQMRGGVQDSVGDEAYLDLRGCRVPQTLPDSYGEYDADELECINHVEAMEMAWAVLLLRAASTEAVGDDALRRYARDAADFELDVIVRRQANNAPARGAGAASRLKRVLAGGAALAALATRRVEHRPFAFLDRRFDGTPERMTRDWSDLDEWEEQNQELYGQLLGDKKK